MRPHCCLPIRWEMMGRDTEFGLSCPESTAGQDRCSRKRVHVRAKLLQSCLTLWDPMDCSPPGSFVHGILQARILEWAAISLLQGIFLTQGSSLCLLCLLYWQVGSPGKGLPANVAPGESLLLKQFPSFVSTGLYKNKERKSKVKSLSCFWLFATPWTVPYQAPLSMGFSRQ